MGNLFSIASHQLCSDPCCLEEDLHPVDIPHLLAIVCDRGEDGAEGLEAHGNVQQMGSEEEIIVVTQN